MGVGAGFSAGLFSNETFGGVVDFTIFSLSFPIAFDLDGFEEPPIRLLSMPHLPLAGSSSGKSVTSGVSAAAFAGMGSGTGVEADGFR